LQFTSYRELSISEIAKKLDVTHQHANYLIKKLKEAGFVKRVRVSGVLMISLTEAGKDVVCRMEVKK
jgi:DNA-binding MarR family transcriptional regulator